VTTLDLFSKGRFMLGAGGGWLKEEFDIMGREFETRGKRFDETLDVMVSLFNNDVTEYSGAILNVPPIGMSPKPDTRPHPPFVFGGHAKPALRRAAQRGNGWLASELSPEEIRAPIAALKQIREDAGRSDMAFEISCAVMGDLEGDLVARYEDAGVDRLVVRPWLRGRDAVTNLTALAGRVM
jgi:alkanesulfonate monooxygenase SsuD/methylene tetrahydromethanopterin reductase-like flavin-dependent oxidoreductase (luciferase family)